MTFSVRPYLSEDAENWDDLCRHALQGTLLHTRRFLSYHVSRFVDCSLVLEDNGRLMGVFPAALSPAEEGVVVSHPGATYGGVIHTGGLRGERMIEALAEICRHYRLQGRRKLIYKAVPSFYHREPAQDDLYALFRVSARRVRCDLSSAIDLQHRLSASVRRRRNLRKAIKHGLETAEGPEFLEAFWHVLQINLASRHDAAPVHDLREICLLADRFPDNVRCLVALDSGRVIGGTLLFLTHTAHHAQYIAASPEGFEKCALDLVFDKAISAAVEEGKRWFDFGTSNEQEGQFLNAGLYRFKSEFGGGGYVYEFYEIDLTEARGHECE